MNQGWIYREQVPPAQAGQTILDYYTQRYRHSSRAEWGSRIHAGQVQLDGQPASPETPLRSGQCLAYHRFPWEEPAVPLAFDIVYQDLDLWVIAKPADLPVLPGGNFLEHTLLRQLQQQYPQDTPTPIHRLGRGTSGLMLLARSPLARAHLSRQMCDRTLRKDYRALVGHSDLPDHFTITQPIGKLPHPTLTYVYGASPDGRFAQSNCRVLQRRRDATLLAVNILTGRPHQIRIHLAAVGYPLIGDPLYQAGGVPHPLPQTLSGPNPAPIPVPGDCGYHLHAERLTFTHPRTAARLTVTCPVPAALRKLPAQTPPSDSQF